MGPNGRFIRTPIEIARCAADFQADDEGSIPFTRSNNIHFRATHRPKEWDYLPPNACPGVPLIQTQRRSSREPVKHPFRSGADYWNGATQGIWIMSTGQPTNDELEARQVRFDNLQAHRERATNRAWATAGWDDTPESLGRIDQIT